jgi:hypothetical protein
MLTPTLQTGDPLCMDLFADARGDSLRWLRTPTGLPQQICYGIRHVVV